MLYRIIPAVLIAGGLMPNTELQYVQPGKTTVVFPGQDRSSGPDPSGHGLALLILGVRISHPLGVLAPGGKKAGDYFDSLLAELDAHPAENGWLGGTLIQERNTSPCSNAHLSIIGYFKTMDHLHAYAHGASHREAWRWWNLNAKDMPHIGVYHETFDVPAHHWEAIYLQTPALGLGKCRTEAEDGQLESMLIDARKGIWRSSTGRMGRGKGQTYDDDPYQ